MNYTDIELDSEADYQLDLAEYLANYEPYGEDY